MEIKKCGLIMRVSTQRQALNDEGSLKNQKQRLDAYIDYENKTSGYTLQGHNL